MFHISMRSVGAPSGLDVPVVRGPSDATRASERVSPAMVQEPSFLVARGPVPRDLSAETRNVRSPEAMDVFCSNRCVAYGGRRGVLGAVARGPVPRDAKCLKQDFQDFQDLQDYLPRNEHSFSNGCLFWSFRTYMSIEKQICHRFQGPLGLNQAAARGAGTLRT